VAGKNCVIPLTRAIL